jgi:3-oxoacyl-[acyl-carrier protein] reductase
MFRDMTLTTDSLHGKVALVTGSSRGIGAAIAAALAAAGARVGVHGRDPAAVHEVRARIEADGGRTAGALGELTDGAQVDRVRDEIEAALGPIEILVANAGGSPVRPGPIEDIAEADWRASVDGNLTATFLTVKSVLPGMKARGRGVILTVSSAAARHATGKSPVAYAAAKAAIEHLTRSVAAQAGPSGVRAACLAPETILTERNLTAIPDDVRESLRRTHPIQRLGVPEDVANAAVFLASDEAGWISGPVLDIAGGAVL